MNDCPDSSEITTLDPFFFLMIKKKFNSLTKKNEKLNSLFSLLSHL